MRFARFVLALLAVLSSFYDGRRAAVSAGGAAPNREPGSGAAVAPAPEARLFTPLLDPSAGGVAVFRPADAGGAARLWDGLLAVLLEDPADLARRVRSLCETAAPRWLAVSVFRGSAGAFSGRSLVISLHHDPAALSAAFAGLDWKTASLAGELILLASSDELLDRQVELYARGGEGDDSSQPLSLVLSDAGALVEDLLGQVDEGDTLRGLIPSANRLLPSLGRMDLKARETDAGLTVDVSQRLANAADAVELVALLRVALAAVWEEAVDVPVAAGVSRVCEGLTLSAEGAWVFLRFVHPLR